MDDACIIRSLEDTGFTASRREVRPNQAVSIAATRGTVVRGESGTLWLTQEGHWQDYILIPGARYVSPEDRKIVVSSLGVAGAVTISQAAPGDGQGFYGSPLRIDPAVVARLEREARSASARFAGEWLAKVLGNVLKGLRALFTPSGDPALRHAFHPGRRAHNK